VLNASVASDLQLLRRAIELAVRARANGNHPFGSLLADADGVVILEAENTVLTTHDCTGHAELNLARDAGRKYDPAFLRACTLYTSTEPCAMCAGAIFWSGIGRVVFALSSETLGTVVPDETGDWTLALSCREVFARGGRAIDVSGPLLEAEGRTVHDGFWPGT
jgi:tRNA(Arg) A34 adenosine deaminase TadA